MKKSYIVIGGVVAVLVGAILYLTNQNDVLREDVHTLESQQQVTTIVPSGSLTVPSSDSVAPVEDSSENSLEGQSQSSNDSEDGLDNVEDDGVVSDSLRVVNQSFLAAFYGSNDNREELLKGFMTPDMFDTFGSENADVQEGTESEILEMSSYYGLIAEGRCTVVNVVPMKNHEEEDTVLMTVDYQLQDDHWKVGAIQFDLLAKLE